MTTGKLKPWQAIVLVVGLAALGYVAFAVMGSGGKEKLSGELFLVDVESGQVFRAKASDVRVVPMPHPDTDRFTLVRATLEDSGWHVLGRDIPVLRQDGLDVSAIENLETGKVRTNGEDPRSLN